MGRTGIDGDQVKDNTIASADLKDGDVQLVDVAAPVLDADNHSFDPTGSIFDPNVVTVGEALRNITDIPIDALTEFEEFVDASLESTTSLGWVIKNNYPYTTATKTVGKYVIDYTASISNSANNREVGVQFSYRLGTTGPWINLFSEVFELAKGGSFLPITSFTEIDVPTNTVIQILVEWGFVNNGTGSIKNAAVKIGKVASA